MNDNNKQINGMLARVANIQSELAYQTVVCSVFKTPYKKQPCVNGVSLLEKACSCNAQGEKHTPHSMALHAQMKEAIYGYLHAAY